MVTDNTFVCHFQVSLPMRLALSGVAGCSAACFCHPLDVIRVQMQTDTVSQQIMFVS